jgi:hypothetical protein
LIKTTDPFPKQAKEGDLHLIEAFDQVLHVTLYRHTDAVNAFQKLKDPTQGWPLRWVMNLGRHGLVLL